jgi:hypothetical protein
MPALPQPPKCIEVNSAEHEGFAMSMADAEAGNHSMIHK